MTDAMNTYSPRPLAEITAGLLNDAPADLLVSDVTLDSRSVSPGGLFLACQGRTHHGIEFAAQAVARGATAMLYEPGGVAGDSLPATPSQIYVAGVPDLSRHVGTIADRFFGEPSAALTVAGVTGTNGKTTCAYLLAQALGLSGKPAAYMGTLGYGMPGQLQASQHTTADAVTVHRQLDLLRRSGAVCVAMEVSSHALDQGRVGGMRFHTAAFTNLTRDHLDYHGTMQDYAAAKARLFGWPGLAARVINVSDAFGEELAREPGATLIATARARTELQAINSAAGAFQYLLATDVQADAAGLSIGIESSWGAAQITTSLVGDFNVDNVLTVCAVLLACGIPLPQVAETLSRCTPPPGRMETFGGRDGLPLVIVDYAHTPDALAKAARAARKHCSGKLTVVFGCGGDRDAGKRPLMGAVAAELADDIVVTDDNPRTEDPSRIVADILTGISQSRAPRVVHDRTAAIRLAINSAGASDAVLIAGKGHEDYQIIGRERRPFSDQAVVRACLAEQACSAR